MGSSQMPNPLVWSTSLAIIAFVDSLLVVRILALTGKVVIVGSVHSTQISIRLLDRDHVDSCMSVNEEEVLVDVNVSLASSICIIYYTAS